MGVATLHSHLLLPLMLAYFFSYAVLYRSELTLALLLVCIAKQAVTVSRIDMEEHRRP